MQSLSALPKHFRNQIENAKALLRPYTKRAYLVGGSVRDMCLNMPLHDLDIEVYDISPERFEALMCESGAVGVGKSFFVYKLGDIDFSLPRIERKSGVGHAAFDVEVCNDEKEASKRRLLSVCLLRTCYWAACVAASVSASASAGCVASVIGAASVPTGVLSTHTRPRSEPLTLMV